MRKVVLVVASAVAYGAKNFGNYDDLRGGAQTTTARLSMLDGPRNLMATFEFEDLLSYSYEYGEAGAGDASTDKGGFGTDFNLGNMNFGPGLDSDNTGRRDGYYVEAASFQGFEDGGTLGVSVAPAGDVDGDGVDDVLIGAPGARHVYVLFGSSNYGSSTLRRRLESNVGAYETAINALDSDSLMILRQDDNDLDSTFGSQVSTAGDVNGDGYDDILVGASKAKGTGRVYVFFGGDRGTLTGHGAWDLTSSKHFPIERGFRIEGDASFQGVGQSVCGGFDLNDDGFDDFVIGLVADTNTGRVDAEIGEAVLIYGTNEFVRSILPIRNLAGKGGSMNPRGVIFALKNKDGAGKKAMLGLEMAALDDVNGDGHDDIAVGAPQYGEGGAAFVIFGGTQYHGTFFLDEMDGSDGFGILGANKGDRCGGDVKKAGDFNGDGYGDIIVGAPAFEHRRGAAYIVLGRKHFGPTVKADITLRGDAFQDVTGYAVAGAGDVDGDGLDDVLVGAFTSDPQGREMAGTVYCVLGGSKKRGIFDLSDLNGFDGFKMYGEHRGDCAGHDVATAGDFNNDGIDDVIVSSVLSNAGAGGNRSDTGTAYVIFGQRFNEKVPTIMPTGPSAVPTPAPSRPRHTLGDGALPFPPKSALDALEAQSSGAVFYGDESLPSIVFPGDVDGDGIDDILAAADGKAYVIYGAADDNLYAGWSGAIDAIAEKDPKGFYGAVIEAPCSIDVVASAGDFNDDGYDDMTLACPSDDGGSGAVFIVLGGDALAANTNLDSDLTLGSDYVQLQGGSKDQNFGFSLSSLDFNADGYTDVLIGSPGCGCAYIYFGGSDLSASIVNANELTASEGFCLSHGQTDLGSAVAGIGDINDDGYDDLAVGAPSAATVCVVFGNNMDISAEYHCDDLEPGSDTPGFKTYTALEDGDTKYEDRHIGFSVAAAGDVDGDAYADFLIGAPGVDHGSGKVYIILGKEDWNKQENTKKAIPIVSSLRRGAIGAAVAGAGDINNDGLDDILIGGSNGMDRAASEPGTAYILYGAAGLADVAHNRGVYGTHTESLAPNHAGIDVRMLDGNDGFALTGTEIGAQAGANVAFGPFDVNNDGVDDLIVAEPGTHQAFLLFGLSSKYTAVAEGLPTPTQIPSQAPTTYTAAPTASPKPTGGFPTPRPTKGPTLRPTPKPTLSMPTPKPSTEPTTLFSYVSVGYVQASIRISNMAASDFGSLESKSVQYAVYDILGDYVLSPNNVTSVTALDAGSIDVTFYLAIDTPSEVAESQMALVEDIYEELNEAVDSGSFALRLAYWATFFEANENLSSLDDGTTSSMLVADESYFSDSNTKPPSSSPTVLNQPLGSDDTSGTESSNDDLADGSLIDDASGGDDASETIDATDDGADSSGDDTNTDDTDAVSPPTPTEETGDAFVPTPMPATSADTGTISVSSSKKDDDGTDAASTTTIVLPLIAFFILCVIACVYMYQQKKGCFAEIDQTVSSPVLGGGDDIAVEADSVQPQSTVVDEADMSAAIVTSKNESSMVEAPASLVTDVQEKIIEADL